MAGSIAAGPTVDRREWSMDGNCGAANADYQVGGELIQIATQVSS